MRRGGGGSVYDLWGAAPEDPVSREAEADFDELAQALAAGARTAFGIVRPSKRRCRRMCTAWQPRQTACRDNAFSGHAAIMTYGEVPCGNRGTGGRRMF